MTMKGAFEIRKRDRNHSSSLETFILGIMILPDYMNDVLPYAEFGIVMNEGP